jgi:hypothetical protein
MRVRVLVLAAVAACGEPQKIILAIDTTAGVPCDIDALRIEAVGGESSTLERDLVGERLPLSITLENDTPAGSFDLTISGLKDGVEVLRASGTLQFGSGGTLAANLVLAQTCAPSTPCRLPDLIPYVAPPAPVVERNECGEIVKRYAPRTTGETFRDVCTVPGANAGKVLMGGARGAAQLPLSQDALDNFGFRFYGQPVRQVWAHEDGYLSFTAENPDPNNDLNPGAFDRDLRGAGVPPPSRSAFVFWDGLTLGSQGVCYALEGQPGTQKLRVTWNRTCHTVTCTADSLNFTIVLDERTNRVAFTYGEMMAANTERARGSTATVGIVNAATGCVASECTVATGLCRDGVTPCGYTQVFSNMIQDPAIANVEFDPIVSPE